MQLGGNDSGVIIGPMFVDETIDGLVLAVRDMTDSGGLLIVTHESWSTSRYRQLRRAIHEARTAEAEKASKDVQI